MGCGASSSSPNRRLEEDAKLDAVMTANRDSAHAKDDVGEGLPYTEQKTSIRTPASDNKGNNPTPSSRSQTFVFDGTKPQQGSLAPPDTAATPESSALQTPEVVPADISRDPVSKLDPDVLKRSHFNFLHFNDVYHLGASAKEPVGGAARFAHVVKQFKQKYDAEVFFSGDCYNPSLMSTVTKGKHMTPVLNELKMRCAVYGNHDFDFGLDVLKELTAASNCPWLMSNVVDTSIKGEPPAANGLMTFVYNQPSTYKDGAGLRIGCIGLGEEEWLSCVKDLPDHIQYRDAVEVATREARKLRETENCDLIIALTHMRHNNDMDFIRKVPEIDALLGGHDHFYRSEILDTGQLVLKSGTDFKNLSFVTVEMGAGKNGRPAFTTEKVDIVQAFAEDPAVADIVSGFENQLKNKIGKELCLLECQMDVTTETVRTSESGMGNLIADIMRDHCEAECAFVNSGILRADVVYHPSALCLKDLLDIIPIEDVVVCIEATGKQILEAVENGLSKWPQHEGRFLQVSGLQIRADPDLPSGSRVLELKVNGRPVDEERIYTASTTAFLCKGCDGFSSLVGVKYLIDSENGPVLPTLVRKAIEAMVPEEAKEERRASLIQLKKEMGPETDAFKNAAEHVKRGYLPCICPQPTGRIILEGVGVAAPTPGSGSQYISASPIGTPPHTAGPVPEPVDRISATLASDLQFVKKCFRDLSKLPAETIEWGLDMLKYLGADGYVMASFPDVGVVQVQFQDGVTHWLPAAAVTTQQPLPARASTPDSLPGAVAQAAPGLSHSFNLPRPASMTGRRGLFRARSAHEATGRKHLPVPKERTLSFILNPVRSEDKVTQKDIDKRSKGRGSLQMQGQHDSEFGEVHEASWNDEASEAPPLDSGATLWDLVWENNTEGVEAFLAAGNRRAVNRKGVGEKPRWQVHAVNHCFYGLGQPDQQASPLHYAAARGHNAMVKLLLDYGADRQLRSDCGFTPRETACARQAIALCRGKQEVVSAMADVLNVIDNYVPTDPDREEDD